MPPAFSKDAIIEAVDAEIPLLVVITEGIPWCRTPAYAWAYNVDKGGKTRIIGPELPPGIITPVRALVGITPNNITGRADRLGLQVGHPDLPDDVRAARPGLLHRYRHRR